ncbi:xylose isomerase [Mycolicibacterium conceptionense]|uniref:Xylose isomerase n=2 Tax=Mycolicibacterium TaxID=1866885 RepID=A0A1A1YV62_9MYCO|nr:MULTISPECIES: sugar phosphate isomerase/epimerase [Mycolicibacterium]MCW1820118.1 sugar phosphate isomerase/epimerase [Mycolicibacterium senegalense]OBB07358.1 xylose isomerase [Mycolicibacterium conceptionense]OBF02656.1 xylose isomerase [Mycolicibacterium conceptionense]OBF23501.1 xylose isomerase [Mycolicibacterium conceptionense]OBF35202.1 xylose isomerase [Mycolicibacterium conceptionense]
MAAPTHPFHSRLGCSTISFRHQPLPQALDTIAGLGFTEIDLGALPGVCDHVPFVLDEDAVRDVSATVAASGIRVRSINGDIGDLNVPLDSQRRAARNRHLAMLVELTAATGADALVLPCGALDHQPVASLDEDLAAVASELETAAQVAAAHGVALWTESLHFFRLCFDTERAQRLTDRLDESVGIVMDFSHIVASGGDPVDFVRRFGPRIRHVHIRDAVPGNINLSVGNGQVDFATGLKSLADAGYLGHFALELETRDVTHDERPAAAAAAGTLISSLI